MSTNIQPQKKDKTKAKKRYLKRKKERRKLRQNTNVSVAGDATSPRLDKDDNNEDEWEDEKVDEAKVGKTQTKRPKKKRKLDLDYDAAPMDVDVDLVNRGSTPSLVGALPSFPLPKHPNAPSKTDLALQGLPKSLVDAEIVWDGETQNLDDIGPKMSGRMKRRLKELGIVELFAVQKVLLPFLLPSETSLYTPYAPHPDVCVSAPTGSGKTLAYAIPVVETLSQRVVTRLRALIVLPTRDLVTQVRETMESLSKGTDLKIGTVTGQHSFANEQIGLVGNTESSDTIIPGGLSRIDILICTPGRLIDHLEGTPNFTLQHLRYLIIDEADKLLAQSFQDWLSRVLAATLMPSPSHPTIAHSASPDALSPFHIRHSPWRLPSSCRLEKPQSSTQKLLFSATITSDPGKLKGLGLRGPVKWVVVRGTKNPKELDAKELGVGGVLDVVMERFEVPSTLTEHYIITPTTLKPLVLFYLVLKHGVSNALVFTKSAESTERLMRLCELFFGEGEGDRTEPNATEGDEGKDLVVRAYSSDLPVSERKTVLDLFKNRKVHILISSDLISRGIDITHVRHVVSYDAPVDMRKYVHRVGRTARAGREGDAWCLVEEHEARYFKQMLLASDHLRRVKKMRVGEQELEGFRIRYDIALGKLRDIYVGGK